ncbi:MAG: hypothetical protein KF744_11705 [Taibaiella sp.]|nr:hypothetical protein [Taibaiella sp.]
MRVTYSILFAAIVFSVSSCTKQKEAELRQKLAGTWLKYKVAWDDNNNARADTKEIHDIPAYLQQTTTFSPDGTGTIIKNTTRGIITSTFTWATTNAKHIKTTSSANGRSIETEYEIKRLKGNELIFNTSTPSLKSDVAWEYYTRK